MGPLKRSTLAASVARRFDTNGDDRRSSFPLKRSTLAAALAGTTIRHQWRRQTFVIPSQTVDARSRTGWHDDSTPMATTDVRHSLSNGRRSQPHWLSRRFDTNGDDRRSSFPLKRSTLAASVARRFDTNGDDRRSSFSLKRSTLAAAVAGTTIRHQWRRQTFVIPSQTVDARSRTGWHDDSTPMATTDVRHSLSNGRCSQPHWLARRFDTNGDD